jgi:hypothetical protein
LTVGFVVVSDLSMSLCGKISINQRVNKNNKKTNHADDRLEQLISRHIDPCHFDGTRFSGRARAEEFMVHYVGVRPGWSSAPLEMGRRLHFADGLHESIPHNDADVSTRIAEIDKNL